MHKADRAIIKDALKWYGSVHQLDKLAEECGELVSAIARTKQKPMSLEADENLVEEMADVFIVLEQLSELYLFKQNAMPRKLARLESRILEEKSAHLHTPEDSP